MRHHLSRNAAARADARKRSSLPALNGAGPPDLSPERNSIDEAAVDYDRGNTTRVSNVEKRVRIEQHEVGLFADFDAPVRGRTSGSSSSDAGGRSGVLASE
jgi:hypothetical protein